MVEEPLSPFMEITSPKEQTIQNSKQDQNVSGGSQTFVMLYALVICIIICIFYYAYSCFCDNQNSFFGGNQVRSDPQNDENFIEKFVEKLRSLQKQNMNKVF